MSTFKDYINETPEQFVEDLEEILYNKIEKLIDHEVIAYTKPSDHGVVIYATEEQDANDIKAELKKMSNKAAEVTYQDDHKKQDDGTTLYWITATVARKK